MTHSTSLNNKLQGKVAIITKGASGMGEAMAHEFAAHGAQAIVIADVQDEKGQNAAVSRRLDMGAFSFFLQSNYIFFAFLAPILLLLLLLIKQRNKLVQSKKLPLIGNLHQLRDLPHRSIQHLSDEHGPLMFLQLGSIPALVISSADMAREIYRTHGFVFSGRPALYAAKKLSYNLSTLKFAPYGEYWREVRKIVILELLSAKSVQSFQVVRNEEVALMLDSIARSSGPPVNLSELILLLTSNIVCRVTFGKKKDGGEDKSRSRFHEILHETQDLLGGFCIADFFPWIGWIWKFNGL
ncbi:hypothetical protein SO802_020296 [Lithocarpus litseifolius]|uniref:Cytochrome P450 n=1 Tax=Lithocarpus litseifolius TaxID=425828 RepID=A0AAW2CGU4_9ROSI